MKYQKPGTCAVVYMCVGCIEFSSVSTNVCLSNIEEFFKPN
jgi:hypothetical protein